jgi:hypothetical protein
MNVYNHKGMKVPGMVQDGGALPKANKGGGLKNLVKKVAKFFKKKKGNPNVIDGKDVTQTRFRGVNRKGEDVVKTGIKGKEHESYVAALVKTRKKLQNKIWKEDLYKNMYQ